MANAREHKVIVIESKSGYEQCIEKAGNKHVLVEFFAQWCGPCRIIGPRLEELSIQYADKLIVVKIDVDDHEELAEEFDISSMPTFLMIKNKVTLEQFIGSSPDKVESIIAKFCGKPGDDLVPASPNNPATAASGAHNIVDIAGASAPKAGDAKSKDILETRKSPSNKPPTSKAEATTPAKAKRQDK